VALALKYATPTQLAAAFRERYRDATRMECARLAKWLLDRIDAGDFTDLQVRTAFGLSAAAWTTLKAKMTTLRTQYNALLAAVGE
jgi:hypothetical protein